jgi:hypothetical protein
MPRVLILVLAGSLLMFTGHLYGQSQDDDGTQGTKIIFHVTSVRQEDAPNDCPTNGCEATRFTVEGYADVRHDSHSTEYVLRCTEILVDKPSPHFADTCGRVHAHNDYDATVFADTIYFADRKKKPEGAPPEALYKIMSEKEVNRPTK